MRGRVFIAAEGKQQKKYIFNDLIDNRKCFFENFIYLLFLKEIITKT
jgi:hypothetical protein